MLACWHASTIESQTMVYKAPRKRRITIKRRRPILFGWLFNSWTMAQQYWDPYPNFIHPRTFFEYLDDGKDIDIMLHHALIHHAERENLTEDFRRKDLLDLYPNDGGPVTQVSYIETKWADNIRLQIR
jgi:hypothetical protein